MNIANNKRSEETQARLCAALLAELEKKPLHAITVCSICSRAGINRSSFYRHYTDIYAIFSQIEQTMMHKASEAFFPHDILKDHPFSRRCFENLFRFIQNHRSYYEILSKDFPGAQVVEFPYDMMNFTGMDLVCRVASVDSVQEMHYRVQYFMGGINSVIRYWVQNDCIPQPGELAQFIENEYRYEVAHIEVPGLGANSGCPDPR